MRVKGKRRQCYTHTHTHITKVITQWLRHFFSSPLRRDAVSCPYPGSHDKTHWLVFFQKGSVLFLPSGWPSHSWRRIHYCDRKFKVQILLLRILSVSYCVVLMRSTKKNWRMFTTSSPRWPLMVFSRAPGARNCCKMNSVHQGLSGPRGIVSSRSHLSSCRQCSYCISLLQDLAGPDRPPSLSFGCVSREWEIVLHLASSGVEICGRGYLCWARSIATLLDPRSRPDQCALAFGTEIIATVTLPLGQH